MQSVKERPSFARRQEFGAAIMAIPKEHFKIGTPQEISQKGDWRLWHKTLILIPLFIVIYLIIVFSSFAIWIKIALLVILGILAASIGFNVGHDANHGSYSKKKWVNDLCSLSFNLLGVVSSFWRFKHNVLHHFFTNLVGIDEDVSAEPLLRLHEQQLWRRVHRAQPYYCWFIYGLIYLVWVLWNDFKKFFQGHIEGHKIPITKKDRWIFWFTKLFHFVFFWFVPITIFGWKYLALGYSIYGFTVGITIAVVFQLAHIVEKTSQPQQEVATKEEWIFHEIATTANFATKNKVVSWCVGGLNFQIEHHLFPKISHIHYKALSQKVKQVCKDFNVDYYEYPTCWSAIRSHFRKIVKLSKKPK